MVEFINNVTDDLRSSWYFRGWLFTWVFFILLGLGGSFNLTADESIDGSWRFKQPINPDFMDIPVFQMVTQNYPQQKINLKSVRCVHGTFGVQTAPCAANFYAPDQCFRLAQAVRINSGQNGTGLRPDQRMVHCVFNVTREDLLPADMVGWELVQENNHMAEAGASSYGAEWLPPDYGSLIKLSASMLVDADNKTLFLYDRSYEPSSDLATPGARTFDVMTVIDHFFIPLLVQVKNEHGTWKSFADLGGLIAVLFVLASILTRLLALVVPNNSKTLSAFNV